MRKCQEGTRGPGCPSPILCAFLLLLCFDLGYSSTLVDNLAPKFCTHPHTQIKALAQVTRFRSGIGHDYSDSHETCRSMKHYFVPQDDYWSTLPIYCPFNGIINVIRNEWAGDQLEIGSQEYPDFAVALFHINTTGYQWKQGQNLTAGTLLGHHIGPQTFSDVAVKRYSNYTLYSYFDVMTDDVWKLYQQNFGLKDRSELIISAEERDKDPLTPCPNGVFPNEGTIPNWIVFPAHQP